MLQNDHLEASWDPFPGWRSKCSETGKLYLATSTADSNRRSSMTHGLPYLAMQVWISEAHMHNMQGGKGMDSMPRMNRCSLIGTTADCFKGITWNEVSPPMLSERIRPPLQIL